MSSPCGRYRPPDLSDTATITAPSLDSRSALTDPTFPNPWIATRAPFRDMPSRASASRVTNMTPRPVASRRPSDPPISTGLPVTTAVTVWRLCMEYVSMIHAITRSLVFTSGAGTSASGPSVTIVAHDRDRGDDLLFGVAQDLVEPGVELEQLGGVVEALHHRFERVLLGQEGVLLGPDELALGLDCRIAHRAASVRECVEQPIQGLLQRLPVALPPHGKAGDQRLGGIRWPAAAELHSVFLGDYNIIRPGGALHEARDVGPVIGVMILIRLELHNRAEAAQLGREAPGLGDTRGGEDAPPAEQRQRHARSGSHPLQVTHRQMGDAHQRGPPLSCFPPLVQPAR